MPGWKTLTIAVLSGAGLALFFTLIWRWPAAVGLGAGVLTSAVVLLTSVSFGVDPARADQAWRDAAPDLVEPRTGPRPNLDPSPPDDPDVSPS
jgi:hypothetical protein